MYVYILSEIKLYYYIIIANYHDLSRLNLNTLFVQGNIILRKFNMCSLGVKLTLFRTFCSPVYSTTLVEIQKSTITKLQIAYHNIF